VQEWSRTIWVDRIGGCHGLHYQLNGQTRSVDGDTPLLWVLRDVLGMTGTKFGSHYHFAETNFLSARRRAETDIDQLDSNLGAYVMHSLPIEWLSVSIAPADRDLEVCVLDYDGIVYSLGFPCHVGAGGAHRNADVGGP